ncbi:MAG: hypothetical protein H6660_17580 [Ardenticatenaceae bacterium]|nr:hypothetical protein [Ardenticatenaceae bacterium]
MSGVWVWIENSNGAMSTISREVIGAARTVADELREDVVAIVLGHDVASVADEAFDLGADEVIGCDDETLANFRVEAYGPLLAQLVQEREPVVLLFGESTRGSDLSAWVAAETDAGLVPDAIAIEVDGETVKATRSVFANKLLSTTFVKDGLQIVTLRSRAFPQAESTGNSGDAEWVDAVVAEGDIPTKIVGFEGKEGTVSLTDASIIVSGGRGVGGPEGFEPIQALVDVLGGRWALRVRLLMRVGFRMSTRWGKRARLSARICTLPVALVGRFSTRPVCAHRKLLWRLTKTRKRQFSVWRSMGLWAICLRFCLH